MTTRARAFTLIELLVVVAIVALLIGLLAPGLAGARRAGQAARCMSNQRQLITAWTMYAGDADGRAMPLAYTHAAQRTGEGDGVFWWGTDGAVSGRVDHDRGLIAPYLPAAHDRAGVFECPAQPPESYASQGGQADALTSTYGYNGYYLSPAHTPGWSASIAHRPWRRLDHIDRPTTLFVFADTIIRFGSRARNTALLDPPMLFSRRAGWRVNTSPTTAFRHFADAGPEAQTIAARADGSVHASRAHADAMVDDLVGAGSVTAHNDPHYVPDWARWPSATVR